MRKTDMVKNCRSILLIWAMATSMIIDAQTPQTRGHESQNYAELSILDSIAVMTIDTQQLYRSRAEAKRKIENLVAQELALLSDSTVSKSSMLYNHYCAKKYANKIQCIRNYRKKDLRKRWVIRSVYKTIWDTLREEKKDLMGINLGSDHHPVGTHKAVTWHTRYAYDSCWISLRGSSNMDGEDNFLLYTFADRRRDTICDIRLPRSLDYGSPIYNKTRQCTSRSRVYIKIYNKSNVNFSPGAFSAFLIVRPKNPKIIAIEKRKAIKICQIK